MLEVEPNGHRQWPRQQCSRRRRLFRSIRQMAAPSICSHGIAVSGAYRFAAQYLVVIISRVDI